MDPEDIKETKTLAELYQVLESNHGSVPLATQASDIIPGEGDPNAEIMLIGEAPGYYESVQRRPFVGRSGQLLRQTLTDIGYPPAQVYISNIVKVRPPDNRDPLPAEILAFKPYLDREILLINPKLIVTLGRFSMAKFLANVKISQVHGRLHKIRWNDRELFVLPMYHPAAALRNPNMKQSFTADFQKLPKIVEWLKDQQ
jgi:uracil-DNA glycosylase